jgi:hypothetical protein
MTLADDENDDDNRSRSPNSKGKVQRDVGLEPKDDSASAEELAANERRQKDGDVFIELLEAYFSLEYRAVAETLEPSSASISGASNHEQFKRVVFGFG